MNFRIAIQSSTATSLYTLRVTNFVSDNLKENDKLKILLELVSYPLEELVIISLSETEP